MEQDEQIAGCFRAIERARGDRPIAWFFDFDGTLCPIVEHPGQARPSAGMNDALARLRRGPSASLAVISGRPLDDLRARLSASVDACAGSHGFELATATGAWRHPQLDLLRGRLAELVGRWRAAAQGWPGLWLEPKPAGLALHFRAVERACHPEIARRVARIATAFPDFRVLPGKCVFEYVPALSWDKGSAILFVMSELHGIQAGADGMPALQAAGIPDPHRLPALVYVGDDRTDEAGFRVADRWPVGGVSVGVGASSSARRARVRLDHPGALRRLLERFALHRRA